MLGKDYMLAIIIVNYDDNIWSDQELHVDSDLPPGWHTIRNGTGTYYWHIPTGTTQWHLPSYSTHDDHLMSRITGTRCHRFIADGGRGSGIRRIESPIACIQDRGSLQWQEDRFNTTADPNAKHFAVRSLGWVEVPEDDLTPGKSSIAVNNCIQQLCSSKCDGRETAGAWGEGQDMLMLLKKDTVSLLDPVDHSLLHCHPVINIRVWGVGCNNGRDFAFVASDKDACMMKCHVFHCNVPAKAISTVLHDMCSKVMAERAKVEPSMPPSLISENMSPEDLQQHDSLAGHYLATERPRDHVFPVEYVGQMPVSKAMGMEVLNRAIDNMMNVTDRDEWEPALLYVSDTMMSLWRGEDREDPLWEFQVRYLTFLGVGYDRHTFAMIVDAGTQGLQCHLLWCEPDAGIISEAVQAACMMQYHKCLVARSPPPQSRMRRAVRKVKQTGSVDGSSSSPSHHGLSSPKFGSSSVKKSILAFFETFRIKQPPVPAP